MKSITRTQIIFAVGLLLSFEAFPAVPITPDQSVDLAHFPHAVLAAWRVLSDQEVAEQLNFAEAVSDEKAPDEGRLKSFFENIKYPSESSLMVVSKAIFEDEEMRYALDPVTGLPPLATVMISYPQAPEKDRAFYRQLFTYLLEVDTSCDYNLEHQVPCSFEDDDLTDLKDIYLLYSRHDTERWYNLCKRLKDQSNTSVRLHNVSDKLSGLLREKTAQQKKIAPQSSYLFPTVLALGCIGVYFLRRYLTRARSKGVSHISEIPEEQAVSRGS